MQFPYINLSISVIVPDCAKSVCTQLTITLRCVGLTLPEVMFVCREEFRIALSAS